MKKVIINGFGRIGKCIFRLLLENYNNVEVVQINEPYANIDYIAYAIKYDSIYGQINYQVYIDDQSSKIVVSGFERKWEVKISSDINPRFCYAENTTIIDSSNEYDAEKLRENNSMFSRILLTKWYENAFITHLYGDNYLFRSQKNNLISCGICDTIGIVPVLSIFNDLEISSISITTLHPFLNYQNLLDGNFKGRKSEEDNIQVGRSVLNTVIPKKSSVKGILCEIFPSLADSLSFMTYRVPIETVATCDMEIYFKNCISEDIVKDLIIENKTGVRYTNDKVVSRDFTCTTCSSTIDLNWLFVKDKKVHLTFYYDNEMGYANSVCQII